MKLQKHIKNTKKVDGTGSYWRRFTSHKFLVLNPFSINVPILYPLKTSKNWRFSNVFSGFGIGTMVENEFNYYWAARIN